MFCLLPVYGMFGIIRLLGYVSCKESTMRPNTTGLTFQYGAAIAERDLGWFCAYCYKILDPTPTYKADCYGNMRFVSHRDSPTVDHVVPISRGGPHDIDNFVLSCKRCNSRKWDRLPGEY